MLTKDKIVNGIINKYGFILKIIFAGATLVHLLNSQAHIQVYIFIFVAFLICVLLNAWKIPCKFRNKKINEFVNHWNQTHKIEISKNQKITKIVFVSILSLCILASNYNLVTNLVNDPLNCVLSIIFISVGSYIMWNEILLFVLKAMLCHGNKTTVNKISFTKHFIVPWAVICIVYFVFFLGNLPGYVTNDGLNQVHQIIAGTYSNHHPYWNTQIIRLFLTVGQAFDSMNLGLSLYMTFQILVISCAFAYVIFTLYAKNVNKLVCKIICCLFCVVPVYIIFSFELFKDILFTAAMCFFVVSLYRILKLNNFNKIVDYFVLGISGLAICVLRSNGLFVFIICLVLFMMFNVGRLKKVFPVCAILIVAVIVGAILKFPVLSALDVKQPDLIEHLSVPGQQIARVAVECDDLTEEEQNAINEVISIDMIKQLYDPMIFDPVKLSIRMRNTQDVILQNT